MNRVRDKQAEVERRAAKLLGQQPPNGANGHHAPAAEKPAADPVPPEWDDPVPLEAGFRVPEFPTGILPARMAELVEAVAAATNSPPDYVAATALGIAAGVVGATRNLDVKERYSELASLYVCVVAPKGSGKTPAASYLMGPLVAEQARRRKEGDKKTRAFVENVTVEKMADMLQETTRGLLMVRDELAALFGGFNQYKAKGQGADRQFYLSCWSGAPITVDRKNPDAEPVFVPHPRLSIVGGIQPRVLARYTADSDDGLFDRFLFSYPDPRPMAAETGLTVPRGLVGDWADAVKYLWGVHPVSGPGGDRPFFLKLAEAAWPVWVDWTAWLAAACSAEDFPEDLRGPAAKLRGYAARLALVVHCLREAYGESAETTVLGAEDMARGVKLAKYFFGHARRVWTHVGRDDRVARARRVLNWAKGQGQPSFSRRDAWRHLNGSFDSIEDLAAPLKYLVQLGWLKYAPPPDPSPSGGRPATPTYLLHPTLLTVDTTDKTGRGEG